MKSTDTQVKTEAGLLTIPQTFQMAIDQIAPLMQSLNPEQREILLAHMQYVSAEVESNAVMGKLIEASTQNFAMALEQRNQALRILSMWQEHGVESAMGAAAEFFQFEIHEGADPELVKRALQRALGFEVGHLDLDALADFYDAVERLAASVKTDEE